MVIDDVKVSAAFGWFILLETAISMGGTSRFSAQKSTRPRGMIQVSLAGLRCFAERFEHQVAVDQPPQAPQGCRVFLEKFLEDIHGNPMIRMTQ